MNQTIGCPAPWIFWHYGERITLRVLWLIGIWKGTLSSNQTRGSPRSVRDRCGPMVCVLWDIAGKLSTHLTFQHAHLVCALPAFPQSSIRDRGYVRSFLATRLVVLIPTSCIHISCIQGFITFNMYCLAG